MGIIIGQFSFHYPKNTVDELIVVTVTIMIENVIAIPLALITVKTIKDYANVEPLLNEIRDEEESAIHNNLFKKQEK